MRNVMRTEEEVETASRSKKLFSLPTKFENNEVTVSCVGDLGCLSDSWNDSFPWKNWRGSLSGLSVPC